MGVAQLASEKPRRKAPAGNGLSIVAWRQATLTRRPAAPIIPPAQSSLKNFRHFILRFVGGSRSGLSLRRLHVRDVNLLNAEVCIHATCCDVRALSLCARRAVELLRVLVAAS